MENASRTRPPFELNMNLVIIAAGAGLFLSTLDTGIINVALPTLSRVFHTTVATIAWTVTLYTLTLTGTLILFGRLSDKYGRVRIYAWGLGLFAISSIFCGLSQNSSQIIVSRAIQGIGAAMLQATAVAIITTTVPEQKRGAALGSLGVLMGLGPVLGPSIGGFLISFVGWRWIFWINVPVVALTLIACKHLFKGTEQGQTLIRLDLKGNLLLSISMLSLLEGLANLPSSGLSVEMTLIPLGLAVVLFGLFLYNELRAKEPIVDLGLFRKIAFIAPILSIFVFGGTTSVGFIIPPYFFERVAHLVPWQVGLINISSPAGLVLFSRVSGRLISRTGTMRPMILGLIIMSVSYATLGQMRADWSPQVVATFLFIYGIGGGLFLPANISAIMAAVDHSRQGTIGAVQRMMQNLGIAVFSAITAVLITASSEMHTANFMLGYRLSWDISAISLAVALGVFVIKLVQRQLRNI